MINYFYALEALLLLLAFITGLLKLKRVSEIFGGLFVMGFLIYGYVYMLIQMADHTTKSGKSPIIFPLALLAGALCIVFAGKELFFPSEDKN